MDFESFITATQEAASPEATYDVFIEAMKKFGFDQTVYSFMTRHASIGFEAGHAVACDYPDEWMEHYFSKKYQNIDPVITEALRSARPFLWDDLPIDSAQAVLMNEAKDVGLLEGVGLPIHNANGEVAALGLASSDGRVDISANRLALVHAYAFQFHNAYTHKLAKEESPRILLTAKESEVLHWMAEGKTLSDIGDIMCLSEDAIRYYLKSLYGKLGANQRTLAVIKAIRYGLLNPYRIGL